MFSHQPSDSAEGFTALRRHDEYYLTGGDLFFLVLEQNHFRVHRYFFERESSVFQGPTRYSCFAWFHSARHSESTAIVSRTTSRQTNFARLLWVFLQP
ncbi:hypothetical protein BDP27DRAFT_1497983 [Rhodocollybia butyracea]|uniref:Uncharacterized protein n=1 Tax=Rhodocollybia butyracea TaxID=206335 RepID=A0A9P5P9U8_9AGAR|nr:hypothetical protein BDP27DRAFT_1497983 [Rhodocollybia butyracea]